MRLVPVVLVLALFGCNGDIPIPDLPCPPFCDLPCPPFCLPEPGAPYDCENPPDLEGLFVRVENPVLDEFLIVFKEPLTASFEAHSFTSRMPQLSSVETFASVGMMAATMDTGMLSTVLADPSVLFVQQVGTKHATIEWNLDRIDQRVENLDGVYDPFSDGEGVNIAIVDTGVTNHSDFEDRLSSDGFSAHPGGWQDGNGHGTHVAGSAAGKNFGVCKACDIYPVRVLNDQGSGSDTDVIRGIEWVVDQKETKGGEWVINMSLGGSPAPALDAAVCSAIEAGVTNVVAAGNDADDSYNHSPARVKQAITVGAMERGDSTAYFSNRGPGVDVYAPGVAIRSAKPGGGSQTMQGTSMASPHVAGAAALMASGKTPAEIEAAIVESATTDALSNVPSETVNLLLYVGKEGQ